MWFGIKLSISLKELKSKRPSPQVRIQVVIGKWYEIPPSYSQGVYVRSLALLRSSEISFLFSNRDIHGNSEILRWVLY